MRIGVAISGGMDSAATALLLKKVGHELVLLHMRLVEDSESSIVKAQRVAELVGEPLQVVDLVDDFKSIVVDYFVGEYMAGRTPSPCPRCNRFIKMDLLAKQAMRLGCEKIATGHYANSVIDQGFYTLTKGHDVAKDQSYFLFMLTPEMLKYTVFPLGSWEKSEVRRFLSKIDTDLSQAEESQELCFIENNDYSGFLHRMGARSLPGPIVDSDGNMLGQHSGIINYTVGQRRGLGICGPNPRYVLRIDYKTNTVVVGEKLLTFSAGAQISKLNVIRPDLALSERFFRVKIRSTSRPVECRVIWKEDHRLALIFEQPQSSVAPGQAAVFYSGNRVVMGGWIDRNSEEKEPLGN